MGATWALFLGLVLALLGGHGANASLAALSCGDNCEPGPDLLLDRFACSRFENAPAHGLRAVSGCSFFQFAAL